MAEDDGCCRNVLDACQLEPLSEVLDVRSGAGRPEDEPTSGGAVIRRLELKSKSNKRGQISNRYLTSAVKSQIEIWQERLDLESRSNKLG